ncbi:hypothetical protein POL68_20555 [Stigmatella sp. ncwal1]|uniref:Uncharacterized protein n=1 Tax=Stigmatella ashevillensis TaxID=2995309 RepID=A0ABT5DB44_9BACT|nr:hypothetical protein [Stigmatella ashevillena]
MAMTCTAEPAVTFDEVVRAALRHGLVPIIVPEHKTISLGGSVAGTASGPWKLSWSAYRGLVPRSPNTTPGSTASGDGGPRGHGSFPPHRDSCSVPNVPEGIGWTLPSPSAGLSPLTQGARRTWKRFSRGIVREPEDGEPDGRRAHGPFLLGVC